MRASDLVLALSLVLLASPLPTQVPSGWFVAANLRASDVPSPQNPMPGDGGLFLVHPRNPGQPIPISGLDPQLTGAGFVPPGRQVGSNCVLIRNGGQDLVVGETAIGLNTSVDLHFLQLNGTVASTVRTVSLGGGGGQVAQIVELLNGDILAAGYANTGPLNASPLVLVQPGAGFAVTPVGGPQPGSPWDAALAIDVAARCGYYVHATSSSSSRLHRFPIPNGVGPVSMTLLCTFPTWVMNIAVEEDGQIVAGAFGAGPGPGVPPTLYRVDPTATPPAPVPIPTAVAHVRVALDVERATGNLVSVGADRSTTPPSNWVSWLTPNGVTETRLTQSLAGGWGVIADLAAHHTPATYGQGTPGANAYRWVFPPDANGLPQVGNAMFSVVLEATPALELGALPICLSGQDVSRHGIRLLVAPPLLTSPTLMPQPAGPLTIPLPIPNNSSLRGGSFFLQSVHLDPQGAQGLVSSGGLKITIL